MGSKGLTRGITIRIPWGHTNENKRDAKITDVKKEKVTRAILGESRSSQEQLFVGMPTEQEMPATGLA